MLLVDFDRRSSSWVGGEWEVVGLCGFSWEFESQRPAFGGLTPPKTNDAFIRDLRVCGELVAWTVGSYNVIS